MAGRATSAVSTVAWLKTLRSPLFSREFLEPGVSLDSFDKSASLFSRGIRSVFVLIADSVELAQRQTRNGVNSLRHVAIYRRWLQRMDDRATLLEIAAFNENVSVRSRVTTVP